MASEIGTVTTANPRGLLNWAGHREGGVKKPFHSGSGRPTGSTIETAVTARLKSWVEDLCNRPNETPRSILLIGGPGNGKTDAVEVTIHHLDERLNLDGALYRQFAAAFSPPAGQLSPRLVEVNVEARATALPAGMPRRIRLVQDATERDPLQPSKPAALLLLDELKSTLNNLGDAVYICCANRGIISEAVARAMKLGADEQVVQLLNRILLSVTSGPKGVACWPLPGFPKIASWPMDVESLAEATESGSLSACHQIFQTAIDPAQWPTSCPAGARCPFCKNRELLSVPETLDALVRLLRYYELGSGKRWTFRDVFSLVAYTLVGTEQEYVERDKLIDPCQWALRQQEQGSKSGDVAKAFRAKLDVMSKLYHHRLFPRWPSLRSGDYYKAQRDMSRIAARELEPLKVLLNWTSARRRVEVTEVVAVLSSSWSNLLDPALLTGRVGLFNKGKADVLVSDVEERFSLSVSDGLELVKHKLSTIEVDVLKDLAVADVYLSSDEMPRNLVSQSRLMQGALRQFACRLTKRSIGVQRGICKDWEHFCSYLMAVQSEDGLKDFRKQLQSMLHDKKNRFCSSLATTFGQPPPYRSRNVTLVSEKVPVKNLPKDQVPGRPPDAVPYVRINNHVVPVNIELFSALREVEVGMRPAVLREEIFALLDTTRSIVTGQVVRDPVVAQEEMLIEIGGCRQRLSIEEGKMRVEDRGDEHED